MEQTQRKDNIKLIEQAAMTKVNETADLIESLGESNLKITVKVEDTSVIPWKPKSNFIKCYETKLIDLLKGKKLTYDEYGILSELSLHIGFETNYIMFDKETYMTQKHIIDMTGSSRTKISTMFSKFKKLKIIFEEKDEHDKRKKKYLINPNYYYKGSKITKETIEKYKL